MAPVKQPCCLCCNDFTFCISAQDDEAVGFINTTKFWVETCRYRLPGVAVGSVDGQQVIERGKFERDTARSGCGNRLEKEPSE